jgi:hypothetical protein
LSDYVSIYGSKLITYFGFLHLRSPFFWAKSNFFSI